MYASSNGEISGSQTRRLATASALAGRNPAGSGSLNIYAISPAMRAVKGDAFC